MGFQARDIRCSLWTKNRNEARRKARWFFFHLDYVLRQLSIVSDENSKSEAFQRKAEELRKNLKLSAENLPSETATELKRKLDELETTTKQSKSLLNYKEELEKEAEQFVRIGEKKANALRSIAASKGMSDTEHQFTQYEEAELNKAIRLGVQISDIERQINQLGHQGSRLRELIPEIGLKNVVQAQNTVSVTSASSGVNLYSERLSVIADSFFENKLEKIRSDKDFNDMKRKVLRFIELLGDPVANEVTPTMIDQAVLDSRKMPKEQGNAQGKTAIEMLGLGLEPRKLQTTNNYLNAAKDFLSWSYIRQRIGHDYSKMINEFKVQTEQESSKRRSWNSHELQIIFYSYLYRYDGAENGKKDGREVIGYARFWVPLIGLFTGARLEEICSLRTDNIVEIDGVWCFDMAEFDERGNPIKKNKASIRVFPIHKHLIKIGLVKYAKFRKEKNELMLFDEKKSEGKWSTSLSKWFNRTFKKRIGFPVGENEIVFHSFRSNVVDEFEMAGISEEVYSRVTGHSTGGTARKTYSFKGRKIFPPRLLVETANAASYEGLDLSHISFDKFCEAYMLKPVKRKARARRSRVIPVGK